jgi:hypothetical protein
MAKHAKIVDGKVVSVMVADPEFFIDFVDDSPGTWVAAPDRIGAGFSYEDGKFFPPKKYNSWVWDEKQGDWVPPVAYPADGEAYRWDEATTAWVADPMT